MKRVGLFSCLVWATLLIGAQSDYYFPTGMEVISEAGNKRMRLIGGQVAIFDTLSPVYSSTDGKAQVACKTSNAIGGILGMYRDINNLYLGSLDYNYSYLRSWEKSSGTWYTLSYVSMPISLGTYYYLQFACTSGSQTLTCNSYNVYSSDITLITGKPGFMTFTGECWYDSLSCWKP